MTMSLADLAADAASRRSQLTQFGVSINPPSWQTFTSNNGVITVALNPPVTNSGAPYLAQGQGLNFPSTNSTSVTISPTFIYQVQLDTSGAFSNPTLYDLGTSASTTISNFASTTISNFASQTTFARARA